MGSVILPAILALSSSPFLFGWAKPVPYNPYNLQKGGRWAEALVAFAGPAANICIAIVFGVIVRFGVLPAEAEVLAVSIVFLNVLLAIFNLLPIPPLDGSKILPRLLPKGLSIQYEKMRRMFEQNIFVGFGVVILAVLLFGQYLVESVSFVTRIILG